MKSWLLLVALSLPAGAAETPKIDASTGTNAGAKAEAKPAEKAPAPAAPQTAAAQNGSLKEPATLNETAPSIYKARFKTTKGDFVVEVRRSWAPRGADRFYNLVKNGYYDDTAFFRVVSGFMVQFGISGDPALNALWRGARIQDDPASQSNSRGMVTFAMGGPNTRTTQVFVNLVDNSRLDSMGFPPFGKVVKGLEVVDALYSGYGEGAPSGTGPNQSLIQTQGNEYLRREFPRLDYTLKASIEK